MPSLSKFLERHNPFVEAHRFNPFAPRIHLYEPLTGDLSFDLYLYVETMRTRYGFLAEPLFLLRLEGSQKVTDTYPSSIGSLSGIVAAFSMQSLPLMVDEYRSTSVGAFQSHVDRLDDWIDRAALFVATFPDRLLGVPASNEHVKAFVRTRKWFPMREEFFMAIGEA